MPEQKYGKRKCLQCGQIFEAVHPAHITCSAKCAAERRHMQRRQAGALARSRRKKYLLDLLASLDEAWANVEWINCRYEGRQKELEQLLMTSCAAHALEMKKLEAELDTARKELAALQSTAEVAEKRPSAAPAAPVPAEKARANGAEKAKEVTPSPVMQECKRMRLRATTLPCGDREECYAPLCEKLGGSSDAEKLAPGEKRCPTCKKPFAPKSPIQKFCSAECRAKAGKA